MRHINSFKTFALNESIKLDIREEYHLDLDSMILTVYYDPEQWDEEYYKDAIKLAAQNQNDSLTYDLEEALSQHGLAIDTSRNHEYDKKSGWIEYNLVQMNPMWVKIK
jgi:nitroreductase